jgi:hypothetical protein
MADDDEEVNPLGTPTTNYGWTKPTVGGDDDLWGGLLNADLDGIDTTVKSVSTVANAAYPASNPAGYITAAAIPAPYVLPTASTSVLGGVMVDGTTVTVAGGGVISAAGAVAVSAIAPSSPVAGSLWFDTNGGQMYVWYNDGNSSQWVPVVNQGYAASSVPLIVRPPAAASWTQRNFGGTTTVQDVANGVKLFDSSTSAINNTMRGITITSPSTPYTIDVTLAVLSMLVGASSMCQVGAGWTDGTKIQYLNHQMVGNSAASPLFNVLNMTNYTTFGSGSGSSGNCLFNPSSMFIRLADDGTSITLALSIDGVTFTTAYSAAKSGAFLGASGYTNVGVFIMGGELGNGGLANVILKSWYVH